MNGILFNISLIVLLIITSCNSKSPEDTALPDYNSENLIIKKIADHTYEHTSYLETEDFGRVASNGMLVIDDGEVLVFDTPATNESSKELIEHLISLGFTIKAVVATHFHEDCVGGLEVFHENNVPSYAHTKTIDLLKKAGKTSLTPLNGFNNILEQKVGDKVVYSEFFGEGHTKDNIVAYFPDDKILFGGCLIKEDGAGVGNLEDANISEWSETVKGIARKYPEIETVIPGHGKLGGKELLTYTEGLFSMR